MFLGLGKVEELVGPVHFGDVFLGRGSCCCERFDQLRKLKPGGSSAFREKEWTEVIRFPRCSCRPESRRGRPVACGGRNGTLPRLNERQLCEI